MITPPKTLPSPDLKLPLVGPRGPVPSRGQLDALSTISSATASAVLHHLGVRQTAMVSPATTRDGAKIVGPAVTLQFMPQREDIGDGRRQEDAEKDSALWHVLDSIVPGDVLVVSAKGDPHSGCFGEMLLTYLKGKGGLGAVIDGYIRDWPVVKKLELPLWLVGRTPNYASQSKLYPWAYNVPIDVDGVLVLPGDVIIADDDGSVVVPFKLIDLVTEFGTKHEKWEAFSRIKLSEGGSIWKYYPLSEAGIAEYENWKNSRSIKEN